MIYLITYDLKKPGINYKRIHDTIKTAPRWWHHLESTWLVNSDEAIEIWQERIKRATDGNDKFLIVDITKSDRQGWLPPNAWTWLKENEKNTSPFTY